MRKVSFSTVAFHTILLIGVLILLFQIKAVAQPQAGDLLWYKHTGYQSGTMEWQGGFNFKVGSGWHQFSKLFATSNGVIYGLKPNGDLVWYKHSGYMTGAVQWSGGWEHKVGEGWGQFSNLFATSNGVIYAVKSDGNLAWYKHAGYNDGSMRWEGGLEHIVGRGGWTQFTKVFAGPNGVIYGVRSNGDLVWYKHTGFNDGSVRWEGGGVVGNGWNQFAHLFATDNGIIYGIKQNGDLSWYKHVGYNDGSVRWEGGLEHIVGKGGWTQFSKVFVGPNGVIYGVVGENSNTPLTGFVDMHTHPMSHLGFGKKLIHGAPDIGSIVPAGTRYAGFDAFKPECNPSDEIAASLEHALGKCSATHQEWAPDNDCGNAIRRLVIGLMEEGKECQSVHGDKFGAPDFRDWPKQNDITHQQMWVDWIERAHEYGGLNIMVALAVNNKTLADAIRGDPPTDDMGSANLQIEEMKKFVSRHSFMEIAYTPQDLRRIVSGGKLAVVLGIEVDNIGNFNNVANLTNEMIRSEIKRLYDMGIRYIFPIHVIDNKFGGTAAYEHNFNYSNKRETGEFWIMECGAPGDKINYYFSDEEGTQLGGALIGQDPFREAITPPPCTGLGHVNTKSLTPQGEFAITEMMKLGMIIDIDHMSQKSANRTLDLAERVPSGGYPVNSGHNGYRGEGGSENSRTAQQLSRIARLNGMVGVGCENATAAEFLQSYATIDFLMSDNPDAVPGIGTDINGLVKGPRARPGSNVQYSSNFPICRTGNKVWDYNREGVAHYGLLADFVRDMQSINAEYTNNYFMKSAEYFAKMWEKCERQKSQVR